MPKDEYWKNQYSPSSSIFAAVNMLVHYEHIHCPKGHYDKTMLEQKGRNTHWQCNVCGRKFWTNEFKMPKSIAR